jgi:hypothetical protein
MPFGVLGLRKVGFSLVVLTALGLTCLSCSGYKATSQNASRLKFRAFISNSLFPAGGGHFPQVEVMDATLDQLHPTTVDLSSLPDIGPMFLSDDKALTVVYSPGGHAFAVINNAAEQTPGNTVTLPDSTQSFLLTPDNLHIFAAVPNATISGQPSGAVIRIDVNTMLVSATIPVPHARFIAEGLSGNTIVAFSDNSGGICSPESAAVTIIDATKIGTSVDPRTTKCSSAGNLPFDHPVGAAAGLSSASRIFVLECGPECGGTSAAVTPIDLNTKTVGARIPVPAATAGLVASSTLYLTGTPPNTLCGSSTQAPACGVLTIVDTLGLKVSNPSPILITDGYHDRMELTGDGLIYIGATGCSNVNVPAAGSNPGEVRGCLSTFDTTAPTTSAKFPPANGDVTGIAPLPGRHVVYTIAGGSFQVWDTTTGQLLPNHQTTIVGLLVDVRAVDNAP